MSFNGRDVLSILDFNRKETDKIFKVADEMEPIVRGEKVSRILEGKILANLFFEPSTRTRLSFESAMLKLGGSVIGFADPSVARSGSTHLGFMSSEGETIYDTVRVVENYANAIAIRTLIDYTARDTASVVNVPVINGGDGLNEHPTQALLDLYTIKREKGKIDGLKIVQIGNLAGSRTAHSFALGLTNFDVDLFLLSPPMMALSDSIIKTMEEKGLKPYISYTDDYREIIKDADILRVSGKSYKINKEILKNCKEDMKIIFPGPRKIEGSVPSEVDDTTYAAYFRQTYYGLLTRMALLSLVLGAID